MRGAEGDFDAGALGAGDFELGAALGGELLHEGEAEAHAGLAFAAQVGVAEGGDALDVLGGHAAAGVSDGKAAIVGEFDAHGGAAAGIVAGVVDEFLDHDAEVGRRGDDGGIGDVDLDVLGALGATGGGLDAGLNGILDLARGELLDEAALLLGVGGEVEEKKVIAEAAMEAVRGGVHVGEDALDFVAGEFAQIGAQDLDQADDAGERCEETVGDGGVERGAELRHHAVLDVGANVGALEAGGDALGEGLDADGLGEEIVGASFHALAGGDLVEFAGHEDDLLVLEVGVGADVFEEGFAVALGHGDIGEDQVWKLLAGNGIATFAGIGFDYAIALAAENGAEEGANVGVVVDQENSLHKICLTECRLDAARGQAALSARLDRRGTLYIVSTSMKFRAGLILGVLALTGCHQTPSSAPHARETPRTFSKIPDVMPAEAAQSFRPETHDLIAPGDVPLLEQIDRENSRVVNAALPSVVRIKASWPAQPRVRLFGSKIPFQLPFAPKSHSEMQSDDTAFSSGVVLSRDGYILTNEHAVTDFTRFEVQLNDKRTYRARVVAADELVDVAILKIDATDLVPLPWGDSDKVQVGEQVFAIGDPFDLADSVSKGIVSAKGRNIPESQEDLPHYEDFIQTDAAINPGNSGGALINIHGELVGLNAAIASTTRLSMGIGFAIPSNLVKYAVEGLFKEGHLVRGYLGVVLPDSVDDGVVNQLGLKTSQGALLADVQPGEPADKANLKPFDFITAVDKHKVDSEASLRLVVAQLPIGKQVEVDFVRGGKPLSTVVQIAEPPRLADDGDSGPTSGGEDDATLVTGKTLAGGNVLSGLQVMDLNERTRDKFRVSSIISSGVVVNDVKAGSAADEKGIEKGDVLQSFSVDHGSSEALASTRDFQNLSGKLKADQGVVLLVYDVRKRNSFIYLEPPLK